MDHVFHFNEFRAERDSLVELLLHSKIGVWLVSLFSPSTLSPRTVASCIVGELEGLEFLAEIEIKGVRSEGLRVVELREGSGGASGLEEFAVEDLSDALVVRSKAVLIKEKALQFFKTAKELAVHSHGLFESPVVHLWVVELQLIQLSLQVLVDVLSLLSQLVSLLKQRRVLSGGLLQPRDDELFILRLGEKKERKKRKWGKRGGR